MRISKFYPLTNNISTDHVWIATETGEPILVAQGVGEGHVLLWTTALGRSWTNLHVKPLFVALLGETLQSAIAQSAAARRTANTVVGDLPALGSAWGGASQLKRFVQQNITRSGSFSRSDNRLKNEVLLRRTEDGFVPVEPLTQPGVYQAAPEARGRMVPVNIEPVAGDTTGVTEQQVTSWLSPIGKVNWLDESNPGATFASFETRTNIGFLLLWITLALVLLELVLARVFSHAKRDQTADAGVKPGAGVGTAVASRFADRIREKVKRAS